ncbi:UNVERIFIED_CONTAM: hypothetical protein RKD50_005114 [Streptomyces canus]
MKAIRFVCSPDQFKTLVTHRKGESDLVRRGGTWFLVATCDVPEPEVYEPVDWIGVDRGIVNLATTSDGTNHQGRQLSRYRRWQAGKRTELQKKNTRSATRRLARRAQKEQCHATHVNHKIRPAGHAFLLALPPARAAPCLQGQAGWGAVFGGGRAFYLAALSALRAYRAGQPVRPGPLCCRRCGLAGPADAVAGVNVRDRARSAWVLVTAPAPSP